MGDQPGAVGAVGTSVVIWIIVVALILFRASRPQRISVTRMWVFAAILMLVAASGIYSGEQFFHVPAWEIVIAAIVGAAAGIPLGMLRGHHTTVSATERHGVMLLGPSWATAAIYIGAFVVRLLIRFIVPVTSPVGNAVGDGLLIFAIAIIGATYYTVYRKYEALDRNVPANA